MPRSRVPLKGPADIFLNSLLDPNYFFKYSNADGGVIDLTVDCLNHVAHVAPLLSHTSMPSLRDIFDDVGLDDLALQQLVDDCEIDGDAFEILADPDCLRALDGNHRRASYGSRDDPVGVGFSPFPCNGHSSYSSASPYTLACPIGARTMHSWDGHIANRHLQTLILIK